MALVGEAMTRQWLDGLKRGAPLEQAALQARRAADRERRTGGSLNAAVDGSLFELQPAASTGAAKALVGASRVKAAGQPQLWVERVVAVNPHVPTVTIPLV